MFIPIAHSNGSFIQYCQIYLTHDSPNVRKTHNSGLKHKNVGRNTCLCGVCNIKLNTVLVFHIGMSLLFTLQLFFCFACFSNESIHYFTFSSSQKSYLVAKYYDELMANMSRAEQMECEKWAPPLMPLGMPPAGARPPFPMGLPPGMMPPTGPPMGLPPGMALPPGFQPPPNAQPPMGAQQPPPSNAGNQQQLSQPNPMQNRFPNRHQDSGWQ